MALQLSVRVPNEQFTMNRLIILLCLIFTLGNAQNGNEKPGRCLYKCSLQDDYVWAVDPLFATICFFNRNPCHLAHENCERENNNEPALQVVTAEKCRKLCNSCSYACPKNLKPVCAYNDQQQTEFSNRCLLDYHICRSGETSLNFFEGHCS